MTPHLAKLFQQAFREVCPRTQMPEFRIEFYRFSGVNNTIRVREGRVLVRVSDLLEGAPAPVLGAILHILVAKLYRKQIEPSQAARYRRYLAGHDMSTRTHLIRQVRGRKRIDTARGRVYDLDEIFDDLNRRFFYGLLGRPQMTWSRDSARRLLGHYDPAHNAIVVSRIFDRMEVPRYAIEYLVYHEMLHLKHPVKLRGSRRCVHSAAFRKEESRFPHLAQAKHYLKQL